jgi:hypothetical protein
LRLEIRNPKPEIRNKLEVRIAKYAKPRGRRV